MPKVLFFDIETAPNLAYVWGQWEQNVIQHKREWYVLCISYKWEGERGAHTVGLVDFPEVYEKDHEDDIEVMKTLHSLLDEADIVIGHNGDRFDIRKSNARFLLHGMQPPSPYQTIDTLKVARKYFMFNSNKLGDLGEHLGLGNKESTGGFETWAGCMRGDEKAWKRMLKYAKQDTVLLEKVYMAMRPWMTNHPNRANFVNGDQACPTCGSSNLNSNGIRRTSAALYRRLQCRDCGAWSRERLANPDDIKPSVVP